MYEIKQKADHEPESYCAVGMSWLWDILMKCRSAFNVNNQTKARVHAIDLRWAYLQLNIEEPNKSRIKKKDFKAEI